MYEPDDGMQPVVMLLVSGVIMFFVIGGLSLLAHYYTLNGIKSKTVGDGQHGTARFATKKEIEETYVEVAYEPEKWRKGENLPTAQGLVLGSIEKAGKLYALVDTGDVHCLMIGAAGVGKTAHFLYPNIEYACACGMSFLTMDTKGDLYRNYAGIAKKYYGYHTAVIDLRNPTRSDGDNMLHLVNKYMDVQAIRFILPTIREGLREELQQQWQTVLSPLVKAVMRVVPYVFLRHGVIVLVSKHLWVLFPDIVDLMGGHQLIHIVSMEQLPAPWQTAQ